MPGGSVTKYGNTVIDSIFDCANSDGSVYDNFITTSTVFNTNILTGATIVASNTIQSGVVISSVIGNFSNNHIRVGTVLACYVTDFTYNEIIKGGYVETIGAYLNSLSNFTANIVNGSVYAMTPGTNSSFNNNNVSAESSISGLSFVGAGGAYSSNTLIGNSVWNSSAVVGTGSVSNCTLINSVFSVINTVNANVYRNISLINSAVGLSSSLGAGIVAFDTINFINTTIQAWDTLGASSKVEFNGCSITSPSMLATMTNSVISHFNFNIVTPVTWSLSDCTVNGGESSTAVKTLDLDDAGIFAAGTITFVDSDKIYGIFKLTGTGAKNITDLVAPPTFKNVFIADSAQVFTFTTTARATVAGSKIAGSAASFALTKTAATGAADQVVIQAINSVNTIISSNILI
jgi:hypothetical protein